MKSGNPSWQQQYADAHAMVASCRDVRRLCSWLVQWSNDPQSAKEIVPDALVGSVINALLDAAGGALARLVPRLGLADCEQVVLALTPPTLRHLGSLGVAHVAVADALARIHRASDEGVWDELVAMALAVAGGDGVGPRDPGSDGFLDEAVPHGSVASAEQVLGHWLTWHHRCDRLVSVPWVRIRMVLAAHPDRLSRVLAATPKVVQGQLAELEMRSIAPAEQTASTLRTAIRQGSLSELTMSQVALLVGRKEAGVRCALRQFPAEVIFKRGRQRLFHALPLVRLLDSGFTLRANSPVTRSTAGAGDRAGVPAHGVEPGHRAQVACSPALRKGGGGGGGSGTPLGTSAPAGATQGRKRRARFTR